MLTNFKAKLTDKTRLVNNVYFFSFTLIEPDRLDFLPGQYMMLKVPKGTGYVSRLYSIASPPNMKSSFDLIIEIVPNGLGSTYIDNVQIGGEIDFMGPGGIFLVKDPGKRKIFLVTGTGIAPVRSMLFQGMQNYELFWGLRNYEDIYLFGELKKYNPKICFSREPNLDSIPAEDRQYFDLGHVDACFEKSHGNLSAEALNGLEFYLCGGRQVVESLRLKLLDKGVPRENIHFEKF
ncbi:MAG: ferredoxin--NADP reductase [Patescibacteria group bacterium]